MRFVDLRRLVLGLGVLFIVIIVVPSPAFAKIPPFTIEVSPIAPQVGETVLTVRFWNDPEHTERARWPNTAALRGFLWAIPILRSSSTARADDSFPIDVRLVRPGVHRGVFVLPSEGTWALCPWAASWSEPCRKAAPARGSAGRLELTAASAESAPSSVLAPPSSRPHAAGRFPLPVIAAALVSAVAVTARVARARRS